MEDINEQLHEAALRGKIKNVKELLKQGANINQTDQDGNTSLHNAVKKDHRIVAEYLIKKGADLEKTNPDGQTPLHLAASLGRLKATKYLLSQGAEVNKEDSGGKTALRSAASDGKLDIIKCLISQGAEVNKEDSGGKTALHSAASEDELDVIKYLISQGAEVNKEDNGGETAFRKAVFGGELKVTKYLLSQGADVNKENNGGETALHSASREGHYEVIKYLISQGADVNEGDNDDETALHLAAKKGHLDVTRYLISQGAEVNKEDNGGETALHIASLKGHLDVIKYLFSQGAEVNKEDNGGETALCSAAFNGDLDVIQYLISQGAEVNKEDKDGATALHKAAYGGELDVTKYLLSQGAEVNKEDKDGATALHKAAFGGELKVTKYLLSQGAEVNKETNDSETALRSAAEEGHLDVTKYLLSQGADVNKKNNDGKTALHGASQNGHLDVTIYLISQGAEVNKEDNDGETALHLAAQKGHLDVTKYLLSQGAKVNKETNHGKTALHIASRKGHLEVIKYLISHGAGVNEVDNGGKTALHNAAFFGHFDVSKYLLSQGAELNKENNYRETALHSASRYGHLDITKYLVSQGADLNKVDNGGRTALHNASFFGRVDVSKYLLSQGADRNKVTNDCKTALHSAAFGGELDVTKYLVSQGAEVNKENNGGETALHGASRNGHLDVTKYLVSQGADLNKVDNGGKTALHNAAFFGCVDVSKYLLSQGADRNKETNDGKTALHSAASGGKLNVTKYLISQGAELNKETNYGETALHGASQKGYLDVTKYLITQGADVNKGNNRCRTALHLASQNGYPDITNYLIGQGAEVNKEDNDGMTPLRYAVQNGDLDVVKVLLAGGARFDTEDIQGHPPLQLASFLGYQSIADLFIDCSNSKLAQNNLTDIHLAIQHGHTSIIEKLVSAGADLNVQSIDGQTCLHKAIKLCYKSVNIVQKTVTLRKISDEYYKGELSPEKALVFYLLDNGAKLDVKDEMGNLPIQYAKDEVIKQMILSRLPSLEEIQSYRDESSAPAIVSVEVERNTSKEIELEDHGVSMFIPAEAVHQNDPCKITMTLLRDPPSVDIQDGESVACYGIRCDPPNMIFHQPVKIRIPHSTLAINPDQVTPDIVSHVWDSVNDLPRTSRMRSSSSPDKPPYCRVYKGHIELYIGHGADWWVLFRLEQQVIRHQLMCTPYIPETVERGKDIEVHIHVHADVPGMDAEVLHDEKHQAYRKAHRSVPFSIISHSGDVTVERDCEGKITETKLLSLKEIHNRMRHNVVLKVPPNEEDTTFNVINITLTQSGKLGVSRSMAFVIRYEDVIKSPEFTSVIREIERTSRNDLPDVDVQKIAEELSIDDFYDLGVALGFQIQQLDALEYKRLKDRQEAIYEMLITWKKRQLPHQNVKEGLLSLLKSEETEAENTKITDTTPTGDISDQYLLTLARQIKSKDFMEIGAKLGFSRNKLENIKHKTLQNRKDANIQMLCTWKASQRSDLEATETLKCVWESVSLASTAANTDESLHATSSATPEITAKPNEPIEPEDMEIITTSYTEQDEINDDLDRCEGTPNTEELCSVALSVKSLPLAFSLGKALRVNDDLIVGFIDLPSSSVLHKVARQLIDSWWNGLKEVEQEEEFAKLLLEYNILDVKTGREEITKAIGSKTDLVDLCHRLNVKPADVLQMMSTFVTFPPDMIGRCTLKMLKEWVHHGGIRERLLEVAQAFRFNDAAVKIAEAMNRQPSYIPFISHGIIDHKGGELTLEELGIVVSIPEGAIPKGIRSVVTLRVSTHDTPRLPVREGEVVITPAIECSLTQELLKPAMVVLPHCTNHHGLTDDSSVILYTRTGPGTFGRRTLTPRTSEILKDKIKFYTRHLQVWALSSTNLQGLQLKCVVFQPLFMTPTEKPTLRVYIIHPYRNVIEDITRKEESASVPYCKVLKELRFSIQSAPMHLKILFHDGAKRNKRMMAIKSILSGKCSPLNFELQFSPEEKGKKNIHIDILQGSSTLAEREHIISIGDEPDYAVDHTDSQGRLQFVSNNLLETLTDVIPSLKDLKSLGYHLGVSYSAVEKYLNRPYSPFDYVSRSGSVEMLRDWRRKVRPSEQVDELHVALHNAGLDHTAEVILPELSSTSKRRFEQARHIFEHNK